jgi:hypothetical protein
MTVQLQGQKTAFEVLLGLKKTVEKLRGLKRSSIDLDALLTDDFINNLNELCGMQLNFNLPCNSAHIITAGF